MATNFGLANLYNVFVLGNMNMSNTDAEGRVAAGGNVTLSNYGVGAGELPEPTACLLTTTSSSTSSTSSTTSSTSSTTSSTSSTTSSSTTTANPSLRRQAITDLFESVALQQTALSHILNAEGEKLQRIFAFDNITPETVLAANHSVESTVNAIAGLESVLEMKLRLFTDCACNPPRN